MSEKVYFSFVELKYGCLFKHTTESGIFLRKEDVLNAILEVAATGEADIRWRLEELAKRISKLGANNE